MTAAEGETAGIVTSLVRHGRCGETADAGAPKNGADTDHIPTRALAALADARPTYVAGLDGTITHANRRYRDLAPAAADPLTPIFPLNEVIARVTTEGASRGHRDTLKTGDGERFFLSDHFPVRDEAGTIVAVCGIYTEDTLDVSARREVLVARERFDDISRLVPGWLWETDADFRLTYVSPRVSEALDMHPRELLGRQLSALGHSGDEARGEGETPLRPGNRSPFRNTAFTITLADGSHRHFRLSGLPRFDQDGQFSGYRGIANDITRMTEARKVASMSQEQLASAIETISDGFALFDSAGELVLVNNRFGEYFRATPDMLAAGRPFRTVIEAAADRDLFLSRDGASEAWLALWPRTKALGEASADLETADGRWFRISGRSTETHGVVTIVSDVTEMKAREETLRAAKELAEQSSRSKSLFLANMSHELRTPLNAIIGFSEIMREQSLGPIANPRYLEYVSDIIDSSRHLLDVINDILEVSKAEAGRIELHEEDLHVDQEIRAAVRLFIKQAAAAGVEVKTEPREPGCTIRADQTKLRQILINLISNAVKFTPSGGTVTIATGLRKNGEFTVTIEDTGIGMRKEDIPTALTPFGQVENSLARRFEGTGLGLPLSQALVEAHGGRLRLDSRPGEGTRLTITLPKDRVVS
ncbi:MAG: ATP-binding protein [Alphaproteobacteria bacterium]|nr:ATP-binding protein [Alphaproteobacteria bacterium]